MSTKVNKAPIIAASRGATSSSKTAKPTKAQMQPSLVLTPATSPKARENGHSAVIAASRDAYGRFTSSKKSKSKKAQRIVAQPICGESDAFSSERRCSAENSKGGSPYLGDSPFLLGFPQTRIDELSPYFSHSFTTISEISNFLSIDKLNNCAIL